MVRPSKVVSMLNNLRGYRDKLALLAAFPEAEFLSDFTKVESAKHLLQVSVETCLDIAHHIVADGGYRTPQDSYDAFVVLNEEKVLPNDFMPTLRQMVSFRNRMVHPHRFRLPAAGKEPHAPLSQPHQSGTQAHRLREPRPDTGTEDEPRKRDQPRSATEEL